MQFIAEQNYGVFNFKYRDRKFHARSNYVNLLNNNLLLKIYYLQITGLIEN